mmetsp:Transcript_6610/g.29094  ORF Transcript_6610/g.29094 Transcript_6610/m.29094 type:complete len:216 (-) Transcript_6610:26-673(-)
MDSSGASSRLLSEFFIGSSRCPSRGWCAAAVTLPTLPRDARALSSSLAKGIELRSLFPRLLEGGDDVRLRAPAVPAEQPLLPAAPHDQLPLAHSNSDRVLVDPVPDHVRVRMHLQDRGLRGLELLHAPVSVGAERHGVRVTARDAHARRCGSYLVHHLPEDGRARRGRGDAPAVDGGVRPARVEESPRGQRRGGAQRERRHPCSSWRGSELYRGR